MKSQFLIPCLISLFGGVSLAQEFTMDSAVRHALSGNRDLQSAYFAVEQARARLLQAGKWPNPELEFAFASDFIANNEGENALSVGFVQPIPLSGRLKRDQEVKRIDVARAMTEIRNQERLLIGETQKAFLTALAIQERLGSMKDAVMVSGKDVEFVKQRLASGQSNVAEVSLSSVSSMMFRQETATLNAELNSALLDLKLLMGLQPESRIVLVGSLANAAKRLERPKRGVAVRPDLTMKQLDKDSALAEAALAKAEAWEDIKVGIEYDYGNTTDMLTEMHGAEVSELTEAQMIGFRISVPLPLWNRNEGRVAEQKAAAARAEAEQIALQLQIEKESATARKRAASFRDALRIFEKETDPALTEAEKQLESNYASGEGNLRDVLSVRSQRAELRSAYLGTFLEYVLALNELETALGANPHLPEHYLEKPTAKARPKKR